MNNEADIEYFAKNPDLLLKLLQDVIQFLDDDDDQEETATMEAQLREISKAVEKLEKIGVAVPDAFRAEKTRLAAALGLQSEAMQVLNHFSDELDEIIKDLNIRVGRSGDNTLPKKTRTRRSRTPKTENKILRNLVIEALQNLGGYAHKNEVLKYMEEKLDSKLLPGDLEWRESTSDYAWQNNTAWERYEMVREGILKSGSPRGLWELSEDDR